MKQKVALFLSFAVTYVSQGVTNTWVYYAELFPTGTLRVFDPSFKVSECKNRHYFTGKVYNTLTNKGNRYFHLQSLLAEFADIATRECFFPFKELHFGYKNAYVPQIAVKVKMDDHLWEAPIQIKAAYKGDWICVDSINKHLVVSKNHSIRSLRDE